MTLTQNQKDLLIGSLLGDGSLQTATKGRTWRYRALQSAQQEAYLRHKYEVLKDLCKTPPQKQTFGDKRTEKTYYRYYFNTLVDNRLRYYGNLFYTYVENAEGKGKMVKDVPMTIQQLLTPRAIAYWYMDDGALKHRGVEDGMRFCTESFSDEGVNRLKKALKNNHGIDSSLVKKTNSSGKVVGNRLYINSKNAPLFAELVRPYMVDCMLYKIQLRSDG
jgi:hypothetical protein